MPVTRQRVRLPGSQRTASGVRGFGVVPPLLPLEVSVLLAPRSSALESIRSPLEAAVRLTPEEYVETRGASPEDVLAVRRFARANRLHVIHVHPGRRTIVLGGTARRFSAAFGVELRLVRSAEAIHHVPRGPVQLPPGLSTVVHGVFGFDSRPQGRPCLHLGDPIGVIQPHGGPPGAYTAERLAAAYQFPSGDGSGQTVGIIELGGGYRRADLEAYFHTFGLRTPVIADVPVAGATNSPTGDPRGPDAQVVLDLELAGALAPQAKFVVYFAPNTERGLVDALTTAIHDEEHRPSILCLSWGRSALRWSPQAADAIDDAIRSAAEMGIHVLAAAGDGADRAMRDPYRGYQVLVDGTALVVAGTGASAPLSAGLAARLEQRREEAGAVAASGRFLTAGAFIGLSRGPDGSYRAPAGWDPFSGLGDGHVDAAYGTAAHVLERALDPNTQVPPVASRPGAENPAQGPRRKPNVRRPGAARRVV